VTDGQVDWLSIRAHREREHADYACLVGPEFAGGQLTSRAMEFEVTLLTVDELAQIVELHAEMPLTLTELRPLFAAVPSARPSSPAPRRNARAPPPSALDRPPAVAHRQLQPRAADFVLAKPDTLLASCRERTRPPRHDAG
jgi:hypothetical protein